MLKIGSIVWGVRDLPRAIAFWSAALDYRLRREPDVDWAMLVPRSGEGMQLSLALVASAQARRHHLDLFTSDREGEVARLLDLGATRVQWEYEPSRVRITWCWPILPGTASVWCRFLRNPLEIELP